MKTYLVTGCAGFIGSNFVHYMLEKYQDIRLVNLDKLTYAGNLENLEDIKDDARHIFVKGDICDKALVTDLIAKYDPDYVINFAAESHVDRSIRNPEIFVESNVLGTVNLLQCCKDAWYDADAKTWKEGKKYLQVSTDEVYGALGAEGYFMETTPLCPHSPYSASKASADMFVKAFHDTYGMPINITRCSNNYGPYQFPEKLIPLLINNAKHHKTLPVYGDGMQIRDWLYVMDHCKAIDMVANGGKDGEVYNVGGHNERPNIFIVKTVIEQLHDRLKDEGISEELIKHVADRLGHDRRYGIDPTKIKNDLGWYPETPTDTLAPAAARCRGRRTAGKCQRVFGGGAALEQGIITGNRHRGWPSFGCRPCRRRAGRWPGLASRGAAPAGRAAGIAMWGPSFPPRSGASPCQQHRRNGQSVLPSPPAGTAGCTARRQGRFRQAERSRPAQSCTAPGTAHTTSCARRRCQYRCARHRTARRAADQWGSAGRESTYSRDTPAPGHGCPAQPVPAVPPAETAKAAPLPMPAPPVRCAPDTAASRPAPRPVPGAWRSGQPRHRWPPGCAAAGCRRTALPRHPAGCAPSTVPAKRRTAQSPPASWRIAAASAGRKAALKTSEA